MSLSHLFLELASWDMSVIMIPWPFGIASGENGACFEEIVS